MRYNFFFHNYEITSRIYEIKVKSMIKVEIDKLSQNREMILNSQTHNSHNV